MKNSESEQTILRFCVFFAWTEGCVMQILTSPLPPFNVKAHRTSLLIDRYVIQEPSLVGGAQYNFGDLNAR